MADELLHLLVELALPKPSQFALENFAGDALVHRFCKRLLQNQKANVKFFVSWECPPDTLVVTAKGASAVVRSERLDTLLLEYHLLSSWDGTVSSEISEPVLTSTVLRWACEFLLGYRNPALAIHATLMRPKNSSVRLHSPFRDETLASVDELTRTAIQCFALAHEVGHIVMPVRPEPSLEVTVDGLTLADHIRWSDREANQPPETLLALEKFWGKHLNAKNLVSEVDADLFAFWAVVDFLCNELGYEPASAITATLQAMEAQLFICAWKNSCRAIASAAVAEVSDSSFAVQEYLIGAEYSARSRVVVRRAGITWALAESEGVDHSKIDFNSFARQVDQLLTPTIGFRSRIFERIQALSEILFQFAKDISRDERVDSLSYIDILEGDTDLKLELFYTLISFGCPGSVNVAEYLRAIASRTSTTQ